MISIIAFSDKGMEIARRIANELNGTCERCKEGELDLWTKEHFGKDELLVYVGSCGIAVRAIAPYVSSKLSDPAVVVIDELKQHVIPILSGHVGHANSYADKIATVIQSEAVFTTATDVNNTFAIDTFAVENGLQIKNANKIKNVTNLVLSGKTVKLKSDLTYFEEYFEKLEGFEISDKDYDVYISYKNVEEDVLVLVAPFLTLGIGCKKNTSEEEIEKAFINIMNKNGLNPNAVNKVCSIDLKSDESGIIRFCKNHGFLFETFSADELNSIEEGYEFDDSEFVRKITGTDNVCERSAIYGSIADISKTYNPKDYCSRADAKLIAKKTVDKSVTMALALCEKVKPLKKLYVVGIGPGKAEGMTIEAKRALERSRTIVGYTKYIELIEDIFPEKEMLATPMMREIERCRIAYDMARKKSLAAIICSGDAGVYGMASPVLELSNEYPDVEVEVIAGVSAVLSGSAVLGAMVAHDFCTISLSDLLTPWEIIEKRLECAAIGDFCIAIYNPSSKKRNTYLKRACEILLKHKSPDTLCGVVKNIGRCGEDAELMKLSQLMNYEADMFTTVFVGNSESIEINGKGVTKRGYRIE